MTAGIIVTWTLLVFGIWDVGNITVVECEDSDCTVMKTMCDTPISDPPPGGEGRLLEEVMSDESSGVSWAPSLVGGAVLLKGCGVSVPRGDCMTLSTPFEPGVEDNANG